MSLTLVLIIVIGMLLLLVFLFAPRPTLDPRIPATRVPRDLDPAGTAQWLKDQESAVPGVIEGAEATIIWADEPETTDLCLLYIHGFSASRQETSPLCDRIAKELGANLVYARLAGHGVKHGAMEAEAEDWIRSLVDSWEIASRLGRRVVIIATSTGAPLVLWLCQHLATADRLHSLVFLSPNFRIRNPFGFLLTWPWAWHWVPGLMGGEHSWEPENELAGRYWTNRYSVRAVIEMQKMVDWARKHGRSDHPVPLLTVYMEGDPTISHEAAVGFHGAWQHSTKQLVRVAIDDGNPQHVFVGEITAPHRVDWCVDTCLTFLRSVD